MGRRKKAQIKKPKGNRLTLVELTSRIKQRSRVPVEGSSASVIRRQRDAD